VNPSGSVTIVHGPFGTDTPPTVTTLVLDKWTDDELLDMGVHLPLALNAMIYFNASSPAIDFSAAIADYSPADVLEPEYLTWSGDESKIYVDLQENNAMVIADVESNTLEGIHS
jgi:hypothetical protein